MKSSEIIPYTRKAYYYETDKMGIVHHSNYIRWLEEARIHMLSEAGYPFEKMEEDGVMIPVLSAQCQYKYPIRFGDTFKIYSTVTQFNGCKMTLEYKIINITAGEKLSAVCKTEHCLTDMNMRPIRTQRKYPEERKSVPGWQRLNHPLRRDSSQKRQQ